MKTNMNSFQAKMNKMYGEKKMSPGRATSSVPPTSNKGSASGAMSSHKKTDGYLDLAIKVLLWAVIFLLPLFFLANTPSALELSKQTLLVGLVGIAFLLWVGRMAIRSQIQFRANFLFVPVFVMLVIFGLSTFFADYTAQSLWGFFGGEGRAYITLLFFATFFVLFVNNIKTKKDVTITLIVTLVSGFLAVLFGVLQLWGKFIIPINGTHNEFFNTVGSVYLFGVYASAMFLLALNLFIYNKSLIWKSVLAIFVAFFFFVMVVVNIKVIWIAMVIALSLVFGRFVMSGGDKNSSFNSVLLMVFLVLSLLMILRVQPIVKKQLPVEVLLTQKTSAKIAWSALKSDFLLGSGPANYINVYRANRPTNLGNFWSTNFNTAASYLLTMATTVGALGVASFLFLVVAGVVYLFKGVFSMDEEQSVLGVGVGSVWVLLTALLLFYVTNMTVLFMWWLMLSLMVVVLSSGSKTQLREFSTGSASSKPSLLFSFVFVLVIIGVIVALYLQEQKYVAAVHFNKALVIDAKRGNIEDVVGELNAAIGMDLDRDLYYRNRSLAFFALANKKIAEKGKDLTAEETAFISERIKQALKDASRAREINPKDVDNQISLVNVYESLLPSMEGAGEKALEYAKEAIELDPNNPVVYQRIANIYITMADLETIKSQAKQADGLPDKAKEYLVLAKDNLNKAIELKPNFLSARLMLVGVYDREGNSDEAINAMIEARKMFPNNPNLAFQLGLLFRREDKLDEALIQFAQAASIDKNYANAHFYLGLTLDDKGEKDLAIKEFEKVLELNPGNELVQKIIDNLKSGKKALAGLQKGGEQQRVETSTTEENASNDVNTNDGSQPNINPEVDAQVIPEEAARNIEGDLNSGTDGVAGDEQVNNEDGSDTTQQ